MEQTLEHLLKGKIPGKATGIEIRKSICTICDPQTQCGLDLYVKDGEIIKVEGSREHPYNQGHLCSKGLAMRQYIYNDERLRTPLKRTGPKGSGQFVPISWDEALDTISEKFLKAKADYGAESVIFFSGYSKHHRPFLKRLANAFGSPNYMTESSTCFQATNIAQKLVFGFPATHDIPNTACLLIWSANPFYTNLGNGMNIRKGLKRGMKMIVVDPRITPTSAQADLHLRLRPGTDGALALAMANVIIEEHLYDEDFIANHSYGFEEYRRYVQEFTPERAQGITGVPSELIREAARLYAQTKPASLMTSSSAVVHHTNGIQNYRAVFMLAALTGNYDIKGGNHAVFGSFIHCPGQITTREREFMKANGQLAPRIGDQDFPIWAQLVGSEAQAVKLSEHILSQKPYPLKAMLGMGLNFKMWPDSQKMASALSQLDFFVNVDLFFTDSCKYADIILPAASSVERRELRCYRSGYIILTQPAISPCHQSRSDFEIIFELAKRLKLDDPLLASGFEACLDWILEPSGLTVELLNQHPQGMFVPEPQPAPYQKYLKKGFNTPSGKMEFKSKLLEEYANLPGFEPLPVYTPPKYSPESTPELAKDYPLILNTGSRLPMFIHTRTYRMSWTNSLRPNHPAVDISPQDAKELGIKQNDLLEISTPTASVAMKANLTQMVLPGIVHMYHGFPGADANRLLESDYLDPLSGFPGYKSCLCRITKVEPSN